jgi:hypothetical protein
MDALTARWHEIQSELRDCKLDCVKGQKLRSNELLNWRQNHDDLSTRTT